MQKSMIVEPTKEMPSTTGIIGKKRGRKLTEEEKYKNDSVAKIERLKV